VDIVPVVEIAIARVGLHVAPFQVSGGHEAGGGFGKLSGLRVDVAGHVEGVRNLRNQCGIAFTAIPGLFGKRRALPAMNDVVVHPGMIRNAGGKILENSDGLEGARTRLPGWGQETVHKMQRQIRCGLYLIRILGEHGAQTAEIAGIGGGIIEREAPAGGDGLDIGPFASAAVPGERLRLLRGIDGSLQGRSHALGRGAFVADELKMGTIISGGDHRHAPPWHRRLRIESRRLQKAPFGLARPKRVHLRYALLKKFLCLGATGSDGERRPALTTQEFGR